MCEDETHGTRRCEVKQKLRIAGQNSFNNTTKNKETQIINPLRSIWEQFNHCSKKF